MSLLIVITFSYLNRFFLIVRHNFVRQVAKYDVQQGKTMTYFIISNRV